MYDITDLKKDVLVQLGGQPYRILDSQHSKQARGGAVMRVKLKNLIDGSVRQETFQGSDKVEPANVQKVDVQYLYRDGNSFVLMDMANYNQDNVDADVLGDAGKYLIEGSELVAQRFNDRIIGVELPKKISVKVANTEPAVRGDTSKAAQKKAELENGTTIFVPLFINAGDTVKIDSQSGKYVERA